MSIIGSNILAGASGSGVSAYEIEQSLRFNSADSHYLNRTPSSKGNATTWTWSGWLKLGATSNTYNKLFHAYYSNSSRYFILQFVRNGSYDYLQAVGGLYSTSPTSEIINLQTTQKFRDPSAWYHIVFAYDSGNTTSSDRCKLYINGTRVTAFGTATYPGQNNETFVNQSTTPHYLGSSASSECLDGYLAEVNFIDGSALGPDSFGKTNVHGVWTPVGYAGSYTGNSFYLKFASGDGTDSSGLSNTWTANNFTTSGTGTDVMSDTPTTNFPTFNPVYRRPPYPTQTELGTLSNGNLDITFNGANGGRGVTFAEMPTSGKFYFEVTKTGSVDANFAIGLFGNYVDNFDNAWRLVANNTAQLGYAFEGVDSSIKPSGTLTIQQTDVVGVQVDLDNNKFRGYVNGVGLTEATGLSFASYSPLLIDISRQNSGGSNDSLSVNFGQREFANPPGTVGATDYFNTVTWTGDGSNPRTLTGVGFQPDFVWIKGRSVGGDLSHQAFDVVRGLSGGNSIQPDRDVGPGEGTGNGYVSAFTSDGFTVDTTSGDIYVNDSGKTYVAWCWKAGGTASTNTDGSITTTVNVSANDDAGFSIVTYEGTGTATTVGHGLSTAPSVIFVKNRTSTQGWRVYHSALSSASKYLELNTTAGEDTANSVFNGTAPTTSVFSIGDGGAVNNSGDDFVAYCWAEKSGVSKFGSYTGNGSSDGPVISCGFRPAMVIIKWHADVNSAESWQLYDNKRAGNPTNTILQPDSASQEESPSDRYIQFTADGFQLKSSGQQINRSGAKYIFMAWAATFTGSDEFKSLNTANLPAPDIADGSEYFNTILWAGDNANPRTLTGVGFQPDWVWLKDRTQSTNHRLVDAVRGAGNTLKSNNTSSETSSETAGTITAFTSDGFTVEGTSNVEGVNLSGDNFVAWNWKAGDSSSSNTVGSITSTVSASPSSGFSVVSYTGNGSGATVGHGLGVPLDMYITKNRDAVVGWGVYHKDLGGNTKYLNLNDTAAVNTNANIWNSTSPTSTVFSVGADGTSNGTGEDMIAYCFAEVEGYSKFGSYTGNGSTDGPFIFTGHRVAWLLIKRYDSGSSNDWYVFDAVRNTYNAINSGLFPSSSLQEFTQTSYDIDFASNGFKFRNSNAGLNASGGTYIFMSLAENPFGGDGVSPATAR